MTPVFRAYQNSTSTPRYARNRAINNRVAPGDVRFGSKADSCSAATHVRFTPDSDPESGLPRKVMSAYPRKRTCAVQLGMSALGQKRAFN
jgi:hypothetical protein